MFILYVIWAQPYTGTHLKGSNLSTLEAATHSYKSQQLVLRVFLPNAGKVWDLQMSGAWPMWMGKALYDNFCFSYFKTTLYFIVISKFCMFQKQNR